MHGCATQVFEVGYVGLWPGAVIGVECVEEGAQYTALWCSGVGSEFRVMLLSPPLPLEEVLECVYEMSD